jgi:multiple sugar transport system substrate-binding protein
VTDSIVMFKNSKVKKDAWKFLDYLFTKEPRVEFTSTEGFLPTTKAEATDPVFNDPDTKAFIALLPTAHFAPTVTGWEDTAKAVTNSMQSVYLGKAKPADALNDAATQANKALGH